MVMYLVYEFSDPYEPPRVLAICDTIEKAKDLFPELYEHRYDENGNSIHTELHTGKEFKSDRYSMDIKEPFVEEMELNKVYE